MLDTVMKGKYFADPLWTAFFCRGDKGGIMRKLNSKGLFFLGMMVVMTVGLAEARAVKVGKKLPNITIKDGKNNSTPIPDFGKKVLTVIYADHQINNPCR